MASIIEGTLFMIAGNNGRQYLYNKRLFKTGGKRVVWVHSHPTPYYAGPIGPAPTGSTLNDQSAVYGYFPNYEKPTAVYDNKYAGAPGFGGILFG